MKLSEQLRNIAKFMETKSHYSGASTIRVAADRLDELEGEMAMTYEKMSEFCMGSPYKFHQLIERIEKLEKRDDAIKDVKSHVDILCDITDGHHSRLAGIPQDINARLVEAEERWDSVAKWEFSHMQKHHPLKFEKPKTCGKCKHLFTVTCSKYEER